MAVLCYRDEQSGRQGGTVLQRWGEGETRRYCATEMGRAGDKAVLARASGRWLW